MLCLSLRIPSAIALIPAKEAAGVGTRVGAGVATHRFNFGGLCFRELRGRNPGAFYDSPLGSCASARGIQLLGMTSGPSQ
jgi:hypothetical protein